MANLKLLLNLNGTDGATSTIDESDTPHSISFVGTAELDTAQKKFGTSSLLVDGNSDYIWAADHSDWSFGSGEFTVDGFFRFNNLPSASAPTLVGQWRGTGSQKSWAAQIVDTAGVKTMRFGHSVNGSTTLLASSSTVTLVAGTWYHYAIVRDGDTLRFFLDGVAHGTSNFTGVTLFSSSAKLLVGALDDTSPILYVDGWLDSIRITKGEALWTSGFTPPSVEPVNPNHLVGSFAGQTTSSGSTSILRKITGSYVGQAVISGTSSILRKITGSYVGQATTGSTATVTRIITGASTGQATISGTITVTSGGGAGINQSTALYEAWGW